VISARLEVTFSERTTPCGWWGSTLAGVPLLHGKGIVYSFHHPGSPWPSQAPVTEATWNRAFGYLASRGIPVVDGEFVNYAGG
jgi:hypothetical protein